MKTELAKMENGQIVHELRQYFTSEQLDEVKEEIDGLVNISGTVEELAARIRSYLDNATFQE